MDFDWLDPAFDLKKLTPREIEESFEDPFGLRILPDSHYGEAESRFLLLARSVSGRGIMSVFWTDGKRYRVVYARDMTPQEQAFYERKISEMNY